MGTEDVDYVSGAVSAVTDYAVGARGFERIAKTSSGTTNVCYPIFDGHGNMVSTLTYSGGNFTLSNQRSYDAWGNIRGGSSNGDPKGRYCASLGHKQDDESGLVYMRARYYDPAAGRFASEDRSKNGSNWLCYCSNNPLSCVDSSGKDSIWEVIAAFGVLVFGLAAMIEADAKNIPAAVAFMILAMTTAAIAQNHTDLPFAKVQADITAVFAGALGLMFSGIAAISNTLAANAGIACGVYCSAIFIELACDGAGTDT